MPGKGGDMWRYVAGVAATLMLAGAGLFWWSGTMPEPPALAAVPDSRTSADPGEPLPEPPAADERSREAKRFARYDRDGDARVTRPEYLASRVKAFERLDADGDGKLSFEEWAKRTTDKFQTADGDRNGALDAREFATTRPARRPSRKPADCPPARSDSDEG